MNKTIVSFYSPGIFVSEVSAVDIDTWDTKKAVEISNQVDARYGAKPYGFILQDWAVMPDVVDEHGNKFKVESKLVRESGIHFLGGTLETYDDVVARNSPKEDILRNNMRFNDMWIVCINTNSYRTTMPFTEKDVIVDAKGNVVERGNDHKYVGYRERMTAQRKAEYKAKYGDDLT